MHSPSHDGCNNQPKYQGKVGKVWQSLINAIVDRFVYNTA